MFTVLLAPSNSADVTSPTAGEISNPNPRKSSNHKETFNVGQLAKQRPRIREIAQVRVRYGYRKIRVLLNREGWKVGKKLVYRLYREEGLTLRHKPRRRRRASLQCRDRFRPTAPNQVWSLDLVADPVSRWAAVPSLDGHGGIYAGKLGYRSGTETKGRGRGFHLASNSAGARSSEIPVP